MKYEAKSRRVSFSDFDAKDEWQKALNQITSETILVQNIKAGNNDVIIQFFRSNDEFANIGFGEKRQTPLHFACRFNQSKIVTSLLDLPELELNAQDVNGDTPLLGTIRQLNSEDDVLNIFTELLSQPKIDVGCKNNDGAIPLHYTVGKGFIRATSLLLNRRFIDHYNSFMIIGALSIAMQLGHDKIFDLIIEMLPYYKQKELLETCKRGNECVSDLQLIKHIHAIIDVLTLIVCDERKNHFVFKANCNGDLSSESLNKSPTSSTSAADYLSDLDYCQKNVTFNFNSPSLSPLSSTPSFIRNELAMNSDDIEALSIDSGHDLSFGSLSFTI